DRRGHSLAELFGQFRERLSAADVVTLLKFVCPCSRNFSISLLFHGSLTGMSKIVGIDLGTTNSLVATVDSGIPLVIADGERRRLTPSVVHVPAPDQPPMVGYTASRVRVLKPTE